MNLNVFITDGFDTGLTVRVQDDENDAGPAVAEFSSVTPAATIGIIELAALASDDGAMVYIGGGLDGDEWVRRLGSAAEYVDDGIKVTVS